MSIPILIDGVRRGTLEMRREGAYLRFEARCALLPGLRRLYVRGGGKSACLGVMQPEGGALVLRRRLSRAERSGFPDPIEYAGFDEPQRAAPPEREERRAESPARREGELMITEDGTRYLALPCALRRSVPGLRLREIGGKRYLLFRC